MLESLLRERRVIVCAGTGGVGKTTVSAALGVLAARLGLNVLVLTIDPTRRLATALGLDEISGDVVVPGQRYAGRLTAAVVEPHAIFEQFILAAAPDDAARLRDNVLYRLLATTLSGSQEFTSLVRLHDAVAHGGYDTVILDTPPSEHTRDFLAAPKRIEALFDGSLSRLFTAPSRRRSLVDRWFLGSTRAWLKTLSLLTGAAFVDALAEFFVSIGPLSEVIAERSRRAGALLASPSTAFALVASPDAAKMEQGAQFYRELSEAGYRLEALIVNRTWPLWFAQETDEARKQLDAELSPRLRALHRRMRRYYAETAAGVVGSDFVRDCDATVLPLPEWNTDISGLEDLERIAEFMATAVPLVPGASERAPNREGH